MSTMMTQENVGVDSLSTPIYIIEESRLRRNLSLIKHVADAASVDIILAFKAFALWKTFPIFREYISSTTASSLFEARLAHEEFGSKAHTYSPAYKEGEFRKIVECSSHLTFNSLSQYERFADKAKAIDTDISIGVRINPEHSEVETDLYNPCAPGTRFGITSDKLPSSLPPLVDGFHCHCHCESSAEEFQRSMAVVEKKFSRWFTQLKWINFGGGHLMTRRDYNVELLISMLNEFHSRYPWLKVILEPGSAFAWQTGFLCSHVVDVVVDKGIKTAILDVSFTCHMPDCLEMPYKPEVRGAVVCEDMTEGEFVYRLGGNSCLSGDFIGSWMFDHELEIGEEIILEDMIHYTTVKTTMFNGITHPSIGILRSDGKLDILREYTYEDYRDRMD